MNDLTKTMYRNRPASEENQGTITEEEAAFLYGLAVALRPLAIAEIGTGWHRSLRALCDAQDYLARELDWKCIVYSCDTRLNAVEAAREKFPCAVVVHGDAEALADRMKFAPELVFIDGDHSRKAVHRDLLEMVECAAPGAVIVLHDCCILDDVKIVADEFGAMILDTPRGMAVLHAKGLKCSGSDSS